jgi:hypothetical protein
MLSRILAVAACGTATQTGITYSGIKICNSPPNSILIHRNDRKKFKNELYMYYTVIQVYSYTCIQLYRYTVIQVYSYTRIQLYRYTVIHVYSYTRIQLYMYTVIHVYSYTCIQLYRDTVIQGYSYTGIHLYRSLLNNSFYSVKELLQFSRDN